MQHTRYEGPRGCICMRDEDWTRFANALDDNAHMRLRAAMEHFCNLGESALQPSIFRWLSATATTGDDAGAFEAAAWWFVAGARSSPSAPHSS